MVMGELMTRPSSHRSPAPEKEKRAGIAKPSTKPTPLFGKGPVVFHTSTTPPGKKPQQSPPSESNHNNSSPHLESNTDLQHHIQKGYTNAIDNDTYPTLFCRVHHPVYPPP
ncbi:hypothetical protein OUZ56_011596 [Daphnia magna]|uniref:Uncharacterized protein n=1 Tax=Daphnia magna TaxID=35525 RepID=A0ABQ9Z0P3_9CRUS|nr:hypothetical protein OUZ56_011596 [Daphnia magna]